MTSRYILHVPQRKYENVLEFEKILPVARDGERHNGFCRSMFDLLVGEGPETSPNMITTTLKWYCMLFIIFAAVPAYERGIFLGISLQGHHSQLE